MMLTVSTTKETNEPHHMMNKLNEMWVLADLDHNVVDHLMHCLRLEWEQEPKNYAKIRDLNVLLMSARNRQRESWETYRRLREVEKKDAE